MTSFYIGSNVIVGVCIILKSWAYHNSSSRRTFWNFEIALMNVEISISYLALRKQSAAPIGFFYHDFLLYLFF